MDTSSSAPAVSSGNNINNANPPSIELAYKKKCIQLKKRLNEIEAENDIMRARNKRSKLYIQKMRLETCIMLERLATLTGMLDEANASSSSAIAGGGGLPSAELRAKAAAIMGEARAKAGQEVLDDETEGSSEERPPTPQERPLRVKRSRRSNMPIDELEAEAAMQFEAASPDKPGNSNNHSTNNNKNNTTEDNEPANSSLPALAPAPLDPSQDQLTSSFRVVNNGNSSNNNNNKIQNDEESPTEEPIPMDVDERVPKSES